MSEDFGPTFLTVTDEDGQEGGTEIFAHPGDLLSLLNCILHGIADNCKSINSEKAEKLTALPAGSLPKSHKSMRF